MNLLLLLLVLIVGAYDVRMIRWFRREWRHFKQHRADNDLAAANRREDAA